MTEISAIYESFNEPEEALKLLQKSMKLLDDKPGQQSTIAACVQLFKIDEAAELFEEAREILEQECSPCHQDTLGVYSNHLSGL
ncbi:putative tetratricopeptide-like helical domain superfamily [Helianthus annuus]|nr:putative tetratricopeptide-like helical domain superfamily [Helianthus annuus]